jgi:hypothetical protein
LRDLVFFEGFLDRRGRRCGQVVESHGYAVLYSRLLDGDGNWVNFWCC